MRCPAREDRPILDALAHIEAHLVAGHFEAEALRLAEHFLPVERQDGGLMPHAVAETCSLIFQLRVGIALRSDPHAAASLEAVAHALGRDIEEEIDAEAGRQSYLRTGFPLRVDAS